MKKIKFPLILKDEYPARNMKELREYFDIGKIYECLCDGRLSSWLEDRQYKEAEEVKECNELDGNLAEKLCKIFQVEYKEQYSQYMKEIQKARTDFVLVGRESTDSEAKWDGIFRRMNQTLFGTVNKSVDAAAEAEDFFDEEVAEESEQKDGTGKKDSMQYMFCSGCGMKVKRDVKFCNYCGKKNTYREVQ